MTDNPDPFSWRRYALCQEVDPEEFFPAERQPAKAAKAICRRCEVQSECLEFALTHNEEHGIWGGLSHHERKAVVKQRLRQQKVTASRAEATR